MTVFTINDAFIRDLSEIVKTENIKVNEPLNAHTYTQMGGNADIFVTASRYEEVEQVVKFANEHNVPFTLIGNGSNMIIKDGGIRGIVLSLKRLDDIQVDGTRLVAQSGARIIDASREALSHSLSGLEFACGIPGTVGGALFMNAGAYGGEIKDVLTEAVVVDREGNLKTLAAEDLDLSYRTSNIPDNGYIVMEARFDLKEANYDDIKAVMDDLTFKRESKQPLEYPSCGSVFKRPPGYFAGKLIQDSDLQGKGILVGQKCRKNTPASSLIKIIATATNILSHSYGATYG